MEEQIKDIRLKFKCDADWDNMKVIDGIKYCDHCPKSVYDFINAKQNDFLTILAENDHNICGKFRPVQMVPQNISLPTWKRWLSAAVLLLGINLFNNKATAQTKTVDTIKQKKVVDQNAVFGGPETVVNFPGGSNAFKDFIISNLRYSEGMKNGRVIISFIVNKDGSLSDFKVLRGLGKLNNDEALRVLKLSPKWAPPIQAGKALQVQYVQAVAFTNAVN